MRNRLLTIGANVTYDSSPEEVFLPNIALFSVSKLHFQLNKPPHCFRWGALISLQEVTVCLRHITCPHWELVLREPGPAVPPQEREELFRTPGWILWPKRSHQRAGIPCAIPQGTPGGPRQSRAREKGTGNLYREMRYS